MRFRVVPPNALPLERGRLVRSVRQGSTNGGGRGAAVGTVQPSVGTKSQTVGDRVGVFQTKARQMDGRVAIDLCVLIGIGIVQQVRRVHHPNPRRADRDTGGDVQALDDISMRVIRTIAVGVFPHRHTVRPRDVVRRSNRHFVEHGSQVLVVADHLQSRGERVLTILHHPHSAFEIKADVDRLSHV